MNASLALRRSPDLFVDVQRLQAWAAAATAAASGTSDALQAAAALYRDDFLAGFSLRDSPAFDDWQITQRTHLAQTRCG